MRVESTLTPALSHPMGEGENSARVRVLGRTSVFHPTDLTVYHDDCAGSAGIAVVQANVNFHQWKQATAPDL